MTDRSRGSVAIKLLVVVVVIVGVVLGAQAIRAKSNPTTSSPSLDGTWTTPDLSGQMVIKHVSGSTYSVTLISASRVTLNGTLEGDTLHLQRATPGDWPVYLQRADAGLDERAVDGGRVVVHLTKQ